MAAPTEESGARPAPAVVAPDEGYWTRTGLPPWVPRLLLLIFIAYALGSWTLDQTGHLSFFIRILVYSLFVSFALEPAVNWLEKHGWKRGVGTGLAMLVALVAGALIVANMIPLVLAEAGNLVDRLPGWTAQVNPYLQRWFGFKLSQDGGSVATTYIKDHLAGWAGNIAGSIFGLAGTAVSLLFELLTIGMFSFYLVAEAPRVRRGVCSLFRPQWQRAILQGWEISIQKMGGFLYSRLLLGIIIAAATYLVLRILGVPFALPLALWLAFFAEFIPNIGTYIGAAVPLAVAAIEKGLVPFIVLLVFILLYQQFENCRPSRSSRRCCRPTCTATTSSTARCSVRPCQARVTTPIALTGGLGGRVITVSRGARRSSRMFRRPVGMESSPASRLRIGRETSGI